MELSSLKNCSSVMLYDVFPFLLHREYPLIKWEFILD